jgi:Sensors of blue-light using FAD
VEGDKTMALIQLIYSSRPFGFDQSVLDGILLIARRNNARNDVSGALICRADLYLQMLEGPEDAVVKTYNAILRDDRHLEVKIRVKQPIDERMFGAWAMLDDPADGWLWTQSEMDAGAMDGAAATEISEVFRTVRRLADSALN